MKSNHRIVPNRYRLGNARLDAGLTGEEVARRLHLSQPAINKYESGKSVPAWPTLKMLALLYGTSVEYLCGETDDPSPDQMIVDIKDAGMAGNLRKFYAMPKEDQDAIRTVWKKFTDKNSNKR